MIVGECGDVPEDDYKPKKREPFSKSEYLIAFVLVGIFAGAIGTTAINYRNENHQTEVRQRRTTSQPTSSSSLDDFAAEEMRKANEAAR